MELILLKYRRGLQFKVKWRRSFKIYVKAVLIGDLLHSYMNIGRRFATTLDGTDGNKYGTMDSIIWSSEKER